MNADDLKYILAEEGRYNDDGIMNEGIEAIDIEEMMLENYYWNRPAWLDEPMWRISTEAWDIDDNEPVATNEDDKPPTNEDDEPPTKKVSSDPHFGDYETPDDAKTSGGENYHINKQKTKRPSPKSERRRLREKRVKDLRVKESRCHKKAWVIDM
jgi:hypothetical protein